MEKFPTADATLGFDDLGSAERILGRVVLALKLDDLGSEDAIDVQEHGIGLRDVGAVEEVLAQFVSDNEGEGNERIAEVEHETADLEGDVAIVVLTGIGLGHEHVGIERGGSVAEVVAGKHRVSEHTAQTGRGDHRVVVLAPVIVNLEIAVDADLHGLRANVLIGVLGVDDTLKNRIGVVRLAGLGPGGIDKREVHLNHVEGLVVGGDGDIATDVLLTGLLAVGAIDGLLKIVGENIATDMNVVRRL